MDDKFEASDLWNRYTLCYITEGNFSRVLSDAGGSLTEKRERKYLCPEVKKETQSPPPPPEDQSTNFQIFFCFQ